MRLGGGGEEKKWKNFFLNIFKLVSRKEGPKAKESLLNPWFHT
jgi:hypothetical protein